MSKIIGILFTSVVAVGLVGCSAQTSEEETGATDDALTTSTLRITCESTNHNYRECDVDGRIQSARVVRQISSARCSEGSSWGTASDYLWVNDGCRAEFEVRVQQATGPNRIRVVDATYGANAGASFGNATRSVQRQCDGRSVCNYGITIGELGDPAWGRRKDFSVRWTCGNGSQTYYEYVAAEANGQRVQLSCPWQPQPDPDPWPPQPPTSCGRLDSGASLYQNEGVRSCNGRAYFVHQRDGNIVLYNNSRVLASSNVFDSRSDVLTMQSDGDLVQYSRTGARLWSSHTGGNRGAWLEVKDDCEVVIHDRNGRPIWHTDTAGCRPEPVSPF